jgi:coenzyme F420-reducing hydrogenase gamma subunit
MSFLDIDERLADLVEKVDILYSPVVDGKEIPQVDVGVIDGALGNEEEVHLAKEMRDRCKILVGWGDCAVFGGINCMRNFLSPEKVLEEAYTETKSTEPGKDHPRGRSSGAVAQGYPHRPCGEMRRLHSGMPSRRGHHPLGLPGDPRRASAQGSREHDAVRLGGGRRA